MATTMPDDDNLTYLTPHRTAKTNASSTSPAMTTSTPTSDLGGLDGLDGDPQDTNGPQPIGASAPAWLEQFTTISAVHAQREQAAREAFLAAGGDCWICRDTGYLGGLAPEDETDLRPIACEQCAAGAAVIAQWRAELVERALATSNIPRRLERIWPSKERLSFDTLPAEAKARAARVQRFAQTWDFRSGRGLFLQGGSSVGKTGLLVAALRLVETRWANETPVRDLRSPLAAPMRRRVWFTTDVALLDTIRASYGMPHIEPADVIERAKTVTLLIVDDLGKADYKDGVGWGVERLYDIIDARYSALLPTWFTSNFGSAQLRKRLGEHGDAIMDRVLDSCDAIKVTGPKLRMGVSA